MLLMRVMLKLILPMTGILQSCHCVAVETEYQQPAFSHYESRAIFVILLLPLLQNNNDDNNTMSLNTMQTHRMQHYV